MKKKNLKNGKDDIQTFLKTLFRKARPANIKLVKFEITQIKSSGTAIFKLLRVALHFFLL